MNTTTDERIRELRSAEVAWLDTSALTLGGIEAGLSGADQQVLTTYFSEPRRFAEPTIEDGAVRCLNCDVTLTGIFGAFTWGLVHGEGTCSRCGWPARLYHYIEFPDRGRERITGLLQYHPDALVLDEDRDTLDQEAADA